MERNIKFLNWKNKYYENYISQINIWIIWNIYQPINHIFHRIRKKKKASQFVWKHKRPHIAKTTLRKKNGAGWMNEPPWLQIMLKSYSHQNVMILAQKQKCRTISKIKNPVINPNTCGHLISSKEARI